MALISLTEKQQQLLEGFVHRRNSQQWLAQRAMIILQLNLGASIKETARRLSLSRNTIRTWLRRWKAEEDNLFATEKQDDKQGIVESVSPRSVGRFLKAVDSSASSQSLLASSQQ